MTDKKPYNKENIKCLFTKDDWEVWENIQSRHSMTKRRIVEPIEKPRQITDWREARRLELYNLVHGGGYNIDAFFAKMEEMVLKCDNADDLQDLFIRCVLCENFQVEKPWQLNWHYGQVHSFKAHELQRFHRLFLPRFYVKDDERP